MGMYYVFINDSGKFDLEDDFPNDLGWFCERAGAWGEDSELHQLKKILDIDLTPFDHTRYDWEDECFSGSIKTSTSKLRELILLLKEKIKNRPDYFEQIKYQEHNSESCKFYLKSKGILCDLDKLLNVMDVYEQNEIEGFEISYG